MNIPAIAEKIHDYTSGYPFLVSRICQLMDERLVPEKFDSLTEAWSETGFNEAIKLILSEDNTLFDSLMGKLTNYLELRQKLRNLLLRGDTVDFLPDDEHQKQLRMYGFIKNNHNVVAVSNRIFEMRLYRQFIGENQFDELRQFSASEKSIFIKNGELDVPKIMEHFINSQAMIHGDMTEKFVEEEGREREWIL